MKLPDVDPVDCRRSEAQSIPPSEQAACANAGPGTDGKCGTNCQNYCALMQQVCAAYSAFWLGDVDKCTVACGGLHDLSMDEHSPELPLYSAGRDEHGDTLQCRLYHVGAAAHDTAAARNHCWHAALSPAPATYNKEDPPDMNPCRGGTQDAPSAPPECSDYCRLVTVACSGDQKVYESEDQCKTYCDVFEPGELLDARMTRNKKLDKSTRGCRYTHAYRALASQAASDKEAECSSASPVGDLCGSRCKVYCSQLQAVCGDVAGGTDTCEPTCKQLSDDDKQLPYSIARAGSNPASLACRFKALVEARVAKVDNNTTEAKARCMDAMGKGTNCH